MKKETIMIVSVSVKKTSVLWIAFSATLFLRMTYEEGEEKRDTKNTNQQNYPCDIPKKTFLHVT